MQPATVMTTTDVPIVTEPHASTIHTTTSNGAGDAVIVEETQTRNHDDRRRHRPSNRTLVIHQSAERTIPEPKADMQRSRRSRKSRKSYTTTTRDQTRVEPITTSTTTVQT